MKLSKRFLFVPLLLAIFAYLFYSAYKNVKDKTLNDFNYQQFALANQSSLGIESFFNYYQSELSGLSKISFISELNDIGKNLLTEFYINHSDQIAAITVVDSKGILKFTFPYNQAVIGQDISNQKHVRTVIETHKPTVSDVFISVQGVRAIAYHIPIISGNEYKGSLAILIPIDKLGEKFVKTIKTGKNGYGWMISENGIELFDPIPGYTGKSVLETYKKNKSVLNLFNKSLIEKKGTTICYIKDTTVVHEKTTKSFAAYFRVSLGNTFWTILIFTPESEVFATLASFRNRLVILFSLVMLVIGTYFYFALKASNILTEEKKRRAVEKILRESENRFRTIFELSPAGIILIDERGTIIEVNDSFCKTLGYLKKEITGKNIRLFASPETDNEIENNILKILSGKTIIHEVKNIRKDGTACIVELYETRINLPDGTPGILSVSNDITEKKHSQERMLTLSRALESIVECVSITDRQNVIKFVNNSFCKTYGYSEEEIIGKNISIIRPLRNTEYTAEGIISETISGGWTGELVNVRKDGIEFPIELTTSPIKDENGNTIGLIGIAADISERKKVQLELIEAKEKAEESDRLKSAFLANMSHELRTPLNAIIGFSGLMVESGPDQNTTSYSQIILKSGQHLLSLVEDIFDTTMIETGQIKINYEKTEIVSLLEEVKDIIYGECLREDKTGVELILKIERDSEPKYLITDSRKLKQVLMNLLRNALKFTDKGYIEFGFTETVDADKNCFQFYVRDTGIGIDKKHHDAIFDKFRQIDDSHTRKFGGMGIGLSIVKKTVEIFGGRIWIESEPSKGSVFYFTIPVIPDKEEKEIKTGGNSLTLKKNYAGKTILIAEDEKSNFDFLKILFVRMNIRVLWAKDGIEALKLCETDPSIDLVLMDIKMPLLNGYEATKLIKSKRPELPIIAQTAYTMISDKIEADEAGCDGYLSKPIRINQLTEVLDLYL
jgi:PAS domain S-box-containing protein